MTDRVLDGVLACATLVQGSLIIDTQELPLPWLRASVLLAVGVVLVVYTLDAAPPRMPVICFPWFSVPLNRQQWLWTTLFAAVNLALGGRSLWEWLLGGPLRSSPFLLLGLGLALLGQLARSFLSKRGTMAGERCRASQLAVSPMLK